MKTNLQNYLKIKDSNMPWGYFEVDPKFYGADFRAGEIGRAHV